MTTQHSDGQDEEQEAMPSERAFQHVRASTERRAHSHSLDAQLTEIKRHCEQHGYELVSIYADEDIAAHNAEISN